METKHDMKEILGEDFFKEEVRCDYLVSAEMKLYWAELLDMYLSFAEVCEKYGLKYFTLAGTMLGAVRHSGFIPWDDDLDVGMLRDDYERFLEIAPKEFKSPLFFQTPYTDPGYYVSWAKIRNSTSTAISKITRHRRFNQGAYIDVFPLDFCCPQKAEEDTKRIYKLLKRCGAYMRRGSAYLNDRQKEDEITYYTDNPLEDWENVQKIASNPEYKNSDFLYCAVCIVDDLGKRIWPTKCFSSTINHKFENIEVKLPVGYDTVLQINYGDYMRFPPINERGARHNEIIFDVKHSYKDYLI